MVTIAELMNMRGRRALVTGAAGGIGRVIARTLAELGADLILVDRNDSRYGTLVEDLASDWGVNVQTVGTDLELQQDRDRLVSLIYSQNNTLDVIVNNAAFVGTTGLPGWITEFENQSIETWRRALEVNLTAVFDLAKGLSPLLRQNKRGVILNIGSIYGKYGPNYSLYADTEMGSPAAYAASKGGLLQLTRWMATTLAPDIRVNAISPGGVLRNQPEAFIQRYEKQTPLSRMATEDDFCGAVAYLASDLSKYVTGQDIGVDGGWGAW